MIDNPIIIFEDESVEPSIGPPEALSFGDKLSAESIVVTVDPFVVELVTSDRIDFTSDFTDDVV